MLAGERLVVYLAFCDLMLGISHSMDRAYMVATLAFPPAPACKVFAYLLNEFVLSQAIIVLATAFNAYFMVVKVKRLNFGKYDWKLTSLAYGAPAIFGICFDSAGLFGPGFAWQVHHSHSGFLMLNTLVRGWHTHYGKIT